MATRIPLPADIYYDALENFPLVTSLAQLLRWQESQTPPALSMAARNDIFDYAKMLLQPASYQLFLQYSEQLSWTLPQPAPAVLPLPEALQGHGYSQAELQAQAHLSGGSASLWEAVRQTVALLEFDAPRQVMMQQQARAMSFHLGVCARGPMVGICKATPVHRNVCKLLTFFVKHILPEHRYTSLAINVNYITPPHQNVQNGPSENLIISLCQQHNSGLWVESPHGSDYVEHQGELRRGEYHSLLDHALLFPAHKRLHAGRMEVNPMIRFDRFTLVAYTVRNWPCLQQPARERLLEVGFDLPETSRSPYEAPALLPPVLC